MKDHMSILEFCQRFPDEKTSAEFIAQQRWGGKPQCPHCGGDRIYRVQGSMAYRSGSASAPAPLWSAPACP
ncbi:MAG: transposase [Synechococcus sp. SB0665_bin_28]|nr:transposase [Synechococcus sp. SB0665_bin_28]